MDAETWYVPRSLPGGERGSEAARAPGEGTASPRAVRLLLTKARWGPRCCRPLRHASVLEMKPSLLTAWPATDLRTVPRLARHRQKPGP